MYSPSQMVADLPEHYAGKADAFRFIKDVPVDWSESRDLDAETAEYIVAARRGKDSQDWFVGGITNDQDRDYDLSFSFLPEGKRYQATVYRDGDTADCDTNPESYVIEQTEVDSTSHLKLHMARGGGFAITLRSI